MITLHVKRTQAMKLRTHKPDVTVNIRNIVYFSLNLPNPTVDNWTLDLVLLFQMALT